MAEDYYKTLGISRDASPADIQKAYRKLARKYHPDLNPDDKTAKTKFQEVQRAFDVLNDPSKRELYDRYGSSFESMGGGGGPRGGRSCPMGRRTARRRRSRLQPVLRRTIRRRSQRASFGDIFSQFRRAGGRPRREAPQEHGPRRRRLGRVRDPLRHRRAGRRGTNLRPAQDRQGRQPASQDSARHRRGQKNSPPRPRRSGRPAARRATSSSPCTSPRIPGSTAAETTWKCGCR